MTAPKKNMSQKRVYTVSQDDANGTGKLTKQAKTPNSKHKPNAPLLLYPPMQLNTMMPRVIPIAGADKHVMM